MSEGDPTAATDATHPSFRIVVPTRRRPDLLKRLLARLAPQLVRLPLFHLVVVNDGSHDDRYDAVISGVATPITYLRLARGLGPGPARQAGFAGASEDYLVSTDDDCVPPPDWLDRLLALATTYPDVDMFAGSTYPIDVPAGWVLREIAHVPNATPSPVVDDPHLITAVTANAMYRRELFEKAGGFADDMTGATEDCFITQKILAAGGSWLVDLHLFTGHRAVQTIRELRTKFFGYGFGGAQYVVREQDWRVAAMHTDGSLRASLTASWSSTRAQWNKPENRAAAAPRRCIRCILTLIARLSYERGWRRGLKHFARRYGRQRPATPRLADRYNDYCTEIVLKRRSAL
ncbi:MAG: glycosyltransferase family 2 protein [Xanthobacteraceae bacterium]